MIRSILTTALLLLLLASSLASAQSPSPPATNTTAPSQPDPSTPTPKAALLTLYSALKNGDIDTVQSLLIFESDTHRELFQLEFTRIWLPLKVLHAVRSKFGDEALKPARIGDLASLENQITLAAAEADKTEFEIDNDSAVVLDKKPSNPNAETALTGVSFRKIKDNWKIVASTFGDMPADASPDLLKIMRHQRNAVVSAANSTLAQLQSNQFKSADEAWNTYESALKKAAAQNK